MTRLHDERGTALIITLMATALLTALGAALVLTTSTESMISANYRSAQQTMYAADAGLERGIQDLLQETTWTSLPGGSTKSGFVDSADERKAPDGEVVDLNALTTALQSDTDTYFGLSADRPVWRVYAHSKLTNLPGVTTRGYVVVWVADDAAESDGDPTQDSNGILLVRAEAFGEGSSRKAVEATLSRSGLPGSQERGYTGQRGHNERSTNARTGDVQTPGESLTEMRMNLSTGGMNVQ